MVSTEAMELLGKYGAKKILGPKFQNDMLHIALATVADADVLASWNFRHIVRLHKIRLFNAVNMERFIDTLNDWGWFGDKSSRPEWYTGAPWT